MVAMFHVVKILGFLIHRHLDTARALLKLISCMPDLINFPLFPHRLSGSTDYSVCHLAELDDNRLNFHGPGSLEAVDRNWGEKAASSITVVSFNFIVFDSIVPFLSKIKNRFVNVAVS